MDAEIEMAFAEFDMGDMDMGQVYFELILSLYINIYIQDMDMGQDDAGGDAGGGGAED